MKNPVTRRLAIGLAVSVGLNLFFGGMIASAWITKRAYHSGDGPRVAGLAGPFDLRRGVAELDPPSREIVRQLREGHRESFRQAGRNMREARRAVRQALTADEIDRAELDHALAEMRRSMDAAQAEMHTALADIATALEPDERRRFLRAALSRHGGRREGRAERPSQPGAGN